MEDNFEFIKTGKSERLRSPSSPVGHVNPHIIKRVVPHKKKKLNFGANNCEESNNDDDDFCPVSSINLIMRMTIMNVEKRFSAEYNFQVYYTDAWND